MKHTQAFLLLLAAGFIFLACNRQPGQGDARAQDRELTDIEAITEMIMEDSTDASLFDQRARAYLDEKNFNLAMRDMLAAIELDPQNHHYMLTLADIYLGMGLLENTMEALDRSLELQPGNIESMLKLSEISIMMKKYREALEYADQAIAVDKSNPLPYFMKGYIFAQAGDTVNAIKSYLETINIKADHYDAYVELGLIYSTRGNPLAVDYFNNALNINPQSVEALYALGMFYQEADDAESAINTYNRILAIDPDNPFANYNIGYVYLVLMNEYEQAITQFETVERIDPSYFEATYNKAYCYELLGNYEMARQLYSQVLEKKVNYPRAIEGLNRIQGK